MAKYCYEGVNSTGAKEKGKILAESAKEAMAELHRRQIVPTKIVRSWLPEQKGNREKFQVNFCKQMAILLEAGIPTMKAVDSAMENQEDAKRTIKDNLAKGYALSTAMQMTQGYFSEFMVSVVRAGELSGNLPHVMARLHEILKKNYEDRKKLQGMMIYPLFLCCASVVLIMLLLYQVLPIFATVFAGFGTQLPWITKMLLGIGDNLSLYLGKVLLVCTIFIGCIWKIHRTNKGGIILDKIKMKIPVFGKMYRYQEHAMFFNTMSMLINSGISIRNSLELLENICQNLYLQFKYKSIKRQITQGSSLSTAMKSTGLYSNMEMAVVCAGEKSGDLASMLAYIGEVCQNEAHSNMNMLSVLIEPVMISLLGLLIGGIVLSTILPILDMMTLF